MNTIEFIVAGSEVKRFHTVNTLITETVGHHSHGVAMMCLVFKPDCSKELLVAALMHDLAEHQTGDIPSPAKKQYGIGAQVDELEERLMREVGLHMPELSDEEKRILKLADIAQGCIFCAREIHMGNARLIPVFNRYALYLEEMSPTQEELMVFATIRHMFAFKEIANERQ